MAESVSTYDPKGVYIIVGQYLISGFADDSLITYSRNEDSFTLKVGATGEACRSMNRNRSGTIKIDLMQSSMSNDILSGLLIIDEQTGEGIVPVKIEEAKSETVWFAAAGWVKKPADLDFKKECSTRSWEIEVSEVTTFTGGYTSVI